MTYTVRLSSGLCYRKRILLDSVATLKVGTHVNEIPKERPLYARELLEDFVIFIVTTTYVCT